MAFRNIMRKSSVLGFGPFAAWKRDCADTDPFVLLQDSFARHGMAYANLVSALARGTENWMESCFPAGFSRADHEAHETLLLLGHTGWIGELNRLLSILVTKQNDISPWIMKRVNENERLSCGPLAASALWDGCRMWAVVLCRLLFRLNTRLQKIGQERELGRQGFAVSLITLQQLQELLMNARRLLLQHHIIHNTLFQDAKNQLPLIKELKQLEKAWGSSTFCGERERNAVLLQIGQLEQWLHAVQPPLGSQCPHVEQPASVQEPWLNKEIFGKKQKKD